LLRTDRRPLGERADLADEGHDAGDVVGRSVNGFVSKESGAHHAPGNGFAMLEFLVAGDGFKGVGEGVAVVENFAEAGFAFVLADDTGFNFDGAADDVFEAAVIAGENARKIYFQEGKELGISDDAVLDDFGEASAEFALGKRGEKFGIDENQAGRIKGADEVFAFRKIDTGFAADGAVDLGDDGGGNLDEGDPAKVRGGDKADNIADDAATNGDEEGFAVGAGANEFAGEGFDRAEIFGGFGVVEEMDLGGREAAADFGADSAPDARRREDMDAGEVAESGDFAGEIFEEAAAAEDRVVAGGGTDADGICEIHECEWIVLM
jgi:hypothetical protein